MMRCWFSQALALALCYGDAFLATREGDEIARSLDLALDGAPDELALASLAELSEGSAVGLGGGRLSEEDGATGAAVGTQQHERQRESLEKLKVELLNLRDGASVAEGSSTSNSGSSSLVLGSKQQKLKLLQDLTQSSVLSADAKQALRDLVNATTTRLREAYALRRGQGAADANLTFEPCNIQEFETSDEGVDQWIQAHKVCQEELRQFAETKFRTGLSKSTEKNEQYGHAMNKVATSLSRVQDALHLKHAWTNDAKQAVEHLLGAMEEPEASVQTLLTSQFSEEHPHPHHSTHGQSAAAPGHSADHEASGTDTEGGQAWHQPGSVMKTINEGDEEEDDDEGHSAVHEVSGTHTKGGKPHSENGEEEDGDEDSDGLPQGWEQANDPASGKTYYFNQGTGVTQWTRP